MIGRRWAVAAVLVVGLLVWPVLLTGVGASLIGDGQAPDGQPAAADLPVAWIESAQPPDWDALRAERQRGEDADLGGASGAAGATGPEQLTHPDPVPEAPPLVLPEADWPAYRWRDGDHTYEVWLDRSVAMVPDRDGFRFADRAGGVAGGAGAASGGYPAFRSAAGALMALPGGVILVLDPAWDAAAVERFLERNGIADAERTVFDFVPNGFVIATEPGFAALHLANDLAAREGVEIATPNWLIQRVLR